MIGVPSMATPAWPSAASQLIQLGIAYVLALPIGWNREREDRSAGTTTGPNGCQQSVVGSGCS